jgi:hypothetical protein
MTCHTAQHAATLSSALEAAFHCADIFAHMCCFASFVLTVIAQPRPVMPCMLLFGT